MDDLLQLVQSERAEALRLVVGHAPVIVVKGKGHRLEGPPLTAENAEVFLQSIADSRQRRHLRENGWAQFFYKFQGSARFLIAAEIERERLRFYIR